MTQNYNEKNGPLQPIDPGTAPLVQVVVVHYGNRQLTQNCLESIRRLTYPNYQVVVIENHSKEDDREMNAPGFSGISVIRNEGNNGFAAACNQGIHEAFKNRADYVWILNNDTEASPPALSALVATAELDPNLGAVGSVLVEPESEIRGGTLSFLTGLPRHITNGRTRKADYLCGASVLLRMKALRNVELFDTTFFLYWEDTDLSFRIRKAGWRLGIAEESRVHHKGSGSAVFQSAGYDFHITASSVHFFNRHCRYWLLPVCISASGRLTRRALAGKFSNARAVWLGLREGLARVRRRDQSALPRLEGTQP